MLKHCWLAVLLTFFILNTTEDDSFLSKFHQNKYKLRDFRMDLKWFNTDVYYDFRVATYKHNRSCAVANMTYTQKVDLDGKKMETLVQGYKFASNEYREFPIRFQVNTWKSLKSNLGGLKCLLDCGNVRLEPFYFHKNVTYRMCNIKINATRLPPLIPTGRYMTELTVIVNDSLICYTFRVYAELYHDVAIEE